MKVSSMPEISLEDFLALLRHRGLPFDEDQARLLHEGYVKLRRMVDGLERPTDMTTGLALVFRPEAAS